MTNLEDKAKEMHEFMETLEAEEQHRNNSGRELAKLYCYYRQYFSRKLARKYATMTYENMVKEK